MFKMYRGGQVVSFLCLIKGNIRSLIAFKPKDLGTNGHMVNEGNTIVKRKLYSKACRIHAQNVLIKGYIRSIIAFKQNEFGTNGHTVNQGHTIGI